MVEQSPGPPVLAPLWAPRNSVLSVVPTPEGLSQVGGQSHGLHIRVGCWGRRARTPSWQPHKASWQSLCWPLLPMPGPKPGALQEQVGGAEPVAACK